MASPANEFRRPVRPPIQPGKESSAERSQSGGAVPGRHSSVSEEKRTAIWNVFKSGRCLCGHEKRRGMAFCGGCYYILPASMRAGLWRKFGSGFEEAYLAAESWLTQGD